MKRGEYRWKRKRRLQVENTKQKGTEVNSRLRYIIEIVEITREDIYVTAEEADEREWRSKSASTVSGISVASYLRFIRHGHSRERNLVAPSACRHQSLQEARRWPFFTCRGPLTRARPLNSLH